MAKRVSILGSTGSVGCSTMELIESAPEKFEIVALTANGNIQLLAEQAKKYKPELAVTANIELYKELKGALSGTGIEIAAGPDAVIEAAKRDTDWVMAAIVGAAGLKSTLAAVEQGYTVGLANKESLVCAGELMMEKVKESGATLLPVDSEHNAIFQVLDFDHPKRIDKIILTASGGPFRDFTYADMENVTPKQAIAHPNWDMGQKISVDSATMMNKGLELIEAYHLFPVTEDQIEIIVHPQSVVHSLVSYIDGSVLCQMGTPDMKIPIAYALAWPDRMKTPGQRLNLWEKNDLSFEAPDSTRFPALKLARNALQIGGGAPTILNAANEISVGRFLREEIGFLDIARIVEKTMGITPLIKPQSISEVFDLDAEARRIAEGIADQFSQTL
ncbi:MAG: 1-deoxy-D-xylulose-5-phosphate reductoisomerase [Rhodospirillales bacterium]|nr:1-deoxy-D-xylulose-5-phosphate reductoisomerase [Rhodospirillales bacterium]